MDPYDSIIAVGQLIGEPHRLAMLLNLVDGQAWPAGDLARAAGIRPSTASHHLDQLRKGQLVNVIQQGRHRYYSLGSADVARAIEGLATLAPPASVSSLRGAAQREALCFARTCYDHLAGQLGVAWTRAWVDRGFAIPGEGGYRISPEAVDWLKAFGVPVCDPWISLHAVDWTERVPHFAGRLAKAMTLRMVELEWLVPGPVRRGLLLTALGERQFRAFGCAWG